MGWAIKNAYLVPTLTDPDEDMQKSFLWMVTLLQIGAGVVYIKREADKAHKADKANKLDKPDEADKDALFTRRRIFLICLGLRPGFA